MSAAWSKLDCCDQSEIRCLIKSDAIPVEPRGFGSLLSSFVGSSDNRAAFSSASPQECISSLPFSWIRIVVSTELIPKPTSTHHRGEVVVISDFSHTRRTIIALLIDQYRSI